MAPRSRSALAASSPSCPVSLCLARYQPLPWGREGLRAREGRGNPSGKGGSLWEGRDWLWQLSRWHQSPTLAMPSQRSVYVSTHRSHLHGLDDGDHVTLAEGQLPGLGLGVVMLGDTLRPGGPVLLQGEGCISRDSESWTPLLPTGTRASPKDHLKPWLGTRGTGHEPSSTPLRSWGHTSPWCQLELLVSLCSPAHPRHGQPSAHQGLPVLSCCHLQKKPKGLWRDRAELACPRSRLLSQATAAVPQAPLASAAPAPHAASHTGWRKRLRAGCKPCLCQLCPGDTPVPHMDGSRTQHSCSLPLPPKRGPSSHQLCWYSRSPAPQLWGSNVVLPGTCFFTSSFRSSASPGPQEAPAMALLMWDAAGLMRGLPGSRDTDRQGWAEVGLSHALAVG